MAKVKGLNELIGRLRKMDASIQAGIKDEIQNTAEDIAGSASVNLGITKIKGTKGDQQIGRNIKMVVTSLNSDYSARVTAEGQGNLPAYREFGCGIHAAAYVPSLPKEWQLLAQSFYKNGQGKMESRPYLYPAYFKHTNLLKTRLLKRIKDETKKK